jgi:acetyl esterase/lipase
MLRSGWQANPYVKKFLARNRPGAQATHGPLLLVTGGDDVLFTEAAARKVVQRMCATGGQVQWRVYPRLGHDPVVYGSLKDQMEWIAGRFAGRPAPDDCQSK